MPDSPGTIPDIMSGDLDILNYRFASHDFYFFFAKIRVALVAYLRASAKLSTSEILENFQS